MPVIFNHTQVWLVSQLCSAGKLEVGNRHLVPATGAFNANINTLTKVSRARKEYSPLVVRGIFLERLTKLRDLVSEF